MYKNKLSRISIIEGLETSGGRVTAPSYYEESYIVPIILCNTSNQLKVLRAMIKKIKVLQQENIPLHHE